jgi:hypothetical protein
VLCQELLLLLLLVLVQEVQVGSRRGQASVHSLGRNTNLVNKGIFLKKTFIAADPDPGPF